MKLFLYNDKLYVKIGFKCYLVELKKDGVEQPQIIMYGIDDVQIKKCTRKVVDPEGNVREEMLGLIVSIKDRHRMFVPLGLSDAVSFRPNEFLALPMIAEPEIVKVDSLPCKAV